MQLTKRTLSSGALACGITLSLLAGCATRNDTVAQAEKTEKARPGIAETRALAEEGFLYGLPLVMNYAAIYELFIDKTSSQYKCPMNQLFNEHRVFTYKDTSVVTPNSDTPYSMLCLDLRSEPFVLSVPAVDKDRYYSVQLCDWNTFNYGYIGSRATGIEPGDYLIVGPDWKGETPPGIKKTFRASTQFTLAIYRTQLFDTSDLPNVEKVQAGYKAQPLSAYLHQPAPKAAPPVDFPRIDKAMAKLNFFDYLDFALQFAPAAPEEQAIRAKLARIGVGPGKTFSFKDLSVEHKVEIGLGMKAGDKTVEAAAASTGKNINGWRVGGLAGGDRAFYHGDWLLRAAVAQAGIYANDPAEAMYPLTRTDATGQPLDGSQHNYTLTFPAGQVPPVNAFWSVTMYDGKTQLLIENPINRYLINSPMLPDMKKNSDGSLTLYLQKDSPGGDKESNWLPAPNGAIYLVMRLYWPRTEAPSILPPGAGTWSPPGIVQVR
jgi:hypothetical protein